MQTEGGAQTGAPALPGSGRSLLKGLSLSLSLSLPLSLPLLKGQSLSLSLSLFLRVSRSPSLSHPHYPAAVTLSRSASLTSVGGAMPVFSLPPVFGACLEGLEPALRRERERGGLELKALALRP